MKAAAGNLHCTPEAIITEAFLKKILMAHEEMSKNLLFELNFEYWKF